MPFKLFSKESISLAPEKKQQLLIIVLVALSLIILFVLYFGFLRPSPPTAPALPSAGPGSGIPEEEVIKKINFDIDFLRNPNFQALKIYGEWPLEIGEKGRVNPFSSY